MTTALVLAGKRDGTLDPLAAAAGVGHKCVVPVAGRPMIAHVLEALLETSAIDDILISIDDGDALTSVPELKEIIARERIRIVKAEVNLADSVIKALEGAAFPVLITTADNVLLDPFSIAAIDDEAAAFGADVAVAFTRRDSVLEAHPDGQRRFYRFSEDSYSNCNAYWLGSRRALGAVEIFRRGGQFAKHPLRIVRAFGIVNLIRFRYGIGTLATAFARFSRRFGIHIRAVVLENGAVAIDVDNVRTHSIAEGLLHARTSAPAEFAVAAE